MQRLFKPDAHGEHVIVTKDEHGDDHSTRASEVRVPEGLKLGSIASLVDAADALALVVECQLENMDSVNKFQAKQVLKRYLNARQ